LADLDDEEKVNWVLVCVKVNFELSSGVGPGRGEDPEVLHWVLFTFEEQKALSLQP
jgi:hypothetical protein